jgi:hypothetical protein
MNKQNNAGIFTFQGTKKRPPSFPERAAYCLIAQFPNSTYSPVSSFTYSISKYFAMAYPYLSPYLAYTQPSSLTEIINDTGSVLGGLDTLKSLGSILDAIGIGNLVDLPDIGSTTDLLISFCMLAANLGEPVEGIYDLMLDHFGVGKVNASSIESAIEKILDINNDVNIVIKSTIPIGYMDSIQKKYDKNILFSPEFLREGKALYDNLYPSRIIISPDIAEAREFAEMIQNCILKKRCSNNIYEL